MTFPQFVQRSKITEQNRRFQVDTEKGSYLVLMNEAMEEAKVYLINGIEKELLETVPTPCCPMHLLSEAVSVAFDHYSKPEVKIGKPNPNSPWVH